MGNELSTKEVAEKLGVDKSTITRMVQRGELKVAREIANIHLFDRNDIELFAARYEKPKGRKPIQRDEVAA